MRSPAIRNPATFVLVKRQELRRLANSIGNAALDALSDWEKTGEGRFIKQVTEDVSRALDGNTGVSSVGQSIIELQSWNRAMENMLYVPFFVERIGPRVVDPYDASRTTFAQRLVEVTSSIKSDLLAYEIREASEPNISEALRDLTPPQKSGPVEFTFDGDVLKIRHRPSVFRDHQAATIDAARDALLKNSAALLQELSSGNHDRRIAALVREAVDYVEERKDIIALGMSSIALSVLAAENEAEFAGVVLARFRALNISIGMYLAQFPEWVRFAEMAASVEYTPSDVETVKLAGEEMLRDLTNAGAAVDAEVPRTLRWMIGALTGPKATLKRAVFGVIRSVENFVSVVYSTLRGWLEASAHGVKEGLANGVKVGVKAISATALIIAATKVATTISPTAEQIIQTTWLSDAAKVVQKAMPDLLK